MESLDDILKDIDSWPVFERVLESSVGVENVEEHTNNSLSQVRDNTPIVDPTESKIILDDEPTPELELDPSIEYQIGSKIYFGDDLYEVCKTNVNGKNQIALVLVENEVVTPQQNAQGVVFQNESQNNRLKNWAKRSSESVGESFDSAVGSSIGSSMDSSLGSTCQDYQQEILQNFEDTVYTTRSVNGSESVDSNILPPVDESIRPGKRPKITDNELTPAQLESRNKRRQRNRECAQRARVRKHNQLNELETKVKSLEGEKKFTNTFHKNKLANVSAKLHGMKWKMKAKVKSMERKMMENKPTAAVPGKALAEKATATTEGLLERKDYKIRSCSVTQ